MNGHRVVAGGVKVETSDREVAVRVVDTLNRFVGTLHAARCTASIWIEHAERPGFIFAAKYSLQMTFGTVMLTLRKFQDLCSGHVLRLVDQLPEASEVCRWILDECERRGTRRAANLLFAHYAPDKSDPPLSPEEILVIIEVGGWTTEEEVVEWVKSMIHKLCLIRDKIIEHYGLPNGPEVQL